MGISFDPLRFSLFNIPFQKVFLKAQIIRWNKSFQNMYDMLYLKAQTIVLFKIRLLLQFNDSGLKVFQWG